MSREVNPFFATGLPASIKDYQAALNAAFDAGIAVNKATSEGWKQEQGEPDMGGVDVFFPVGITRPTIEEVTRKPEQGEPVAWMTTEVTTGTQVWLYKKTASRYQNPPTPLYTTPQQRKPLTFKQIESCFQDGGIWGVDGKHLGTTAQGLHDFARAIEAAHGIKE